MTPRTVSTVLLSSDFCSVDPVVVVVVVVVVVPCSLDTTMLLPITSQTEMFLSRNTAPAPEPSTSSVDRNPLGLGLLLLSQTSPVLSTPFEMSPHSRMVAAYVPGDNPRTVRSTTRTCGETWTMRAKPRIGSATLGQSVSRMQTAALLGAPLPRRMGSRPVDLIAETIRDGATKGTLNESVNFVRRRSIGKEAGVEKKKKKKKKKKRTYRNRQPLLAGFLGHNEPSQALNISEEFFFFFSHLVPRQ